MRAIAFLWFFKVCWDDSAQWTLIFSFLIPLSAYFIVIEIFRLLMDKKVTTLNVILAAACTTFVNEVIIKPAVNAPPYMDTCDLSLSVPSTAIAVAATMTIIYGLRMMYPYKELWYLISWACVLVASLISFPILHYFSWAMSFVSLIPGLVIGAVFWFIVEFKQWGSLLDGFYTLLHLKDDINPDRKMHAQEIVPE